MDGKSLQADEDEYLLDVLLRHKVDIDHSCGGMGTCGTCRVFVQKNVDKLPERNEVEQDMAEMRGMLANERLSCQTACTIDLKIEIP